MRLRAVVQRVSRAAVTVDGNLVGQINAGFVILLGVANGDEVDDAVRLGEKIAKLRVFEDDDGKMNRGLLDVGGSALVVSQFTLLGDCRKGRRPSFVEAAKPELANALYERFVEALQGEGITVETGRFQTHMGVELVNDGPVTLLLDSRRQF